MDYKANFSSRQLSLIKRICELEVEAVTQLLQEPLPKDIVELEVDLELNLKDFDLFLMSAREKFQATAEAPENLLANIKGDNLKLFKNIFAIYEKDWMRDYPRAVRNLWAKLFTMEDVEKVVNLN